MKQKNDIKKKLNKTIKDLIEITLTVKNCNLEELSHLTGIKLKRLKVIYYEGSKIRMPEFIKLYRLTRFNKSNINLLES